MGNTFSFALNTGSYSGNGSTGSGYVSATGNRPASNVNLNRVSRDIASGYIADIEAISTYVAQGDITQAVSMYDSLFDDVKQTSADYGYNLSDGQISSILNQAYAKATGESLTSAVNKETKGSFMTGLMEGIPLIGLFCQSKSSAEATAEITGTKTKWTEQVKEVGGAAAAGAATGAAIGTIVPGVGTAFGAVVGGVIGGGQAILKNIFNF